MKGLGCLESPMDTRDRRVVGPTDTLLGAGSATPPVSMDLLPLVDFVNDQVSTESCVLQAIQQQHYISLRRAGVAKPPRLSRLFGYWHARRLGGTNDRDRGCVPRLAWKSLSRLGFCREVFWEFLPQRVNSPPSFDATARAVDQTWLSGYYRVWGATGRVEEVKQALAAGHPVVFGTPVDQEFMNYEGAAAEKRSVLGIPTGKSLGRHMMCALGYDQDGLWVVNSWGDWGHGSPGTGFRGFFRMGWDWVLWDQATDWWAVEFAKEFKA